MHKFNPTHIYISCSSRLRKQTQRFTQIPTPLFGPTLRQWTSRYDTVKKVVTPTHSHFLTVFYLTNLVQKESYNFNGPLVKSNNNLVSIIKSVSFILQYRRFRLPPWSYYSGFYINMSPRMVNILSQMCVLNPYCCQLTLSLLIGLW